MQNENLRWDDLQVFLAVVRAGSLNNAASRLGVNVSTVARRIEALEERLGRRLFIRGTRGAHSTELAKSMALHVEKMEANAFAALQCVAETQDTAEGRVILTAPPNFVEHFLGPALVSLKKIHPRITIEEIPDVDYLDVESGEANIALRTLRPKSGDLRSVCLGKYPFCILGSADYIKKLGTLNEWNDAEWITWPHRNSLDVPEVRWLQQHIDDTSIVYRSTSFSAQLSTARQGMGVFLAPLPYSQMPQLVCVELSSKLQEELNNLEQAELWMVGPSNVHEVQKFSVVWNHIHQYITSG